MIFNLTKKSVISHKPYFKLGIFASVRGIRDRNFLSNDSVVLQRCNFIHTFFTSYAVDIIFLDINNKIIRAVSNAGIYRILKEKNAINIIVLKSGRLKQYNIEAGDLLDLNAETVQSPFKTILKSNLIRNDAPVMPVVKG